VVARPPARTARRNKRQNKTPLAEFYSVAPGSSWPPVFLEEYGGENLWASKPWLQFEPER